MYAIRSYYDIRYDADQEIVGFQLNGSPDDMMLDALPALDAGN